MKKRPAFSPEFEFLLGCIRYYLDTGTAKQMQHQAKQVNDWQHFLTLVNAHKTVFVIHYCIKENNALFPTGIRKYITRNHLKNTGEMMKLSKELKEIATTFNKNSIDFISIKGPLLAKSLYGDYSNSRRSGDLDVLINENDIIKADRVLQDNNYSLIINKAIIQSYLSEKYKNFKLKTDQHIAYISETNRNFIELHWRLSHPIEINTFSTQTDNLLGEKIKTLSPEDSALYLFRHGSKHYYHAMFWLMDIAVLLQDKKLNWNYIIDRAKKYDVYRGMISGAILAEKLFAIELPENLKQEISNNKKESLSDVLIKILYLRELKLTKQLTKFQAINYYFLLKYYFFHLYKKRINKIRYLFTNFIDPRTWDYLKLPKKFFFLYYLLWPFLVIPSKMIKRKKA